MRLLYGIIFALILAIAGAGAWVVWGQDEEPVTLTVLAGPRDSDSFKLMSEISEVVERHSDRVRLRVTQSLNSSTNISLLQQGIADLATVQSNTPAYSDIQLVAELFSDHFVLIVHGDARVFRVADLAGKKTAIPEEGSANSRSFWAVIDHYGVAPEGFRTFSVERERAVDLFIRRQVDGIFLVSSLRDPKLLAFIEETQLRGMDIRFIPIEQAEAMALKRPHIEAKLIVAGAFAGAGPIPVRNVPTAALDRLLVAREGVDEDAVNALVEVIFENRLDLLIRMPLSSNIAGPDAEQGASLPVHPGAQRYYDRNEPSFLQENAEPLALVITVSAMIFSALLALRRSLSNRAKNRADKYNYLLLDIAKEAEAAPDRAALQALTARMDEVLETVVRALDLDEVTEEGFQSFSFLWQTVKDKIDARKMQLG